MFNQKKNAAMVSKKDFYNFVLKNMFMLNFWVQLGLSLEIWAQFVTFLRSHLKL